MKKDQTQNESPRSSTPAGATVDQLAKEYLDKLHTLADEEPDFGSFESQEGKEQHEKWEEWNKKTLSINEQYRDHIIQQIKAAARRAADEEYNKFVEQWPQFEEIANSGSTHKFLSCLGAPTEPLEEKNTGNYFKFDLYYAAKGDMDLLKRGIAGANLLFEKDKTAAKNLTKDLETAASIIWPAVPANKEANTRSASNMDVTATIKENIAENESQKRCDILYAFFIKSAAYTGHIKNPALKNHVMQNSAVTNYLQAHPVLGDKQGFDVPVIPARKKNEPITTFVQLQYTDEALQAVTPRKLTEQERAMNDAICSLIKAGQPVFDDTAVYTAMYGSGRPTPNFTDDLDRWIWEAAGIRVELDATDEMRKRGIAEAGEAWTKKQMFYSVQGLKRSKNGHLKNYYHFIEKPPLLAYCEANNQLATVPQEYLDVKAPAALAPADWKAAIENGTAPATLTPIKMSVQRSAMLYYMLRRIAAMKYEDERYRKAAATAERYNRPCLAKKPITRILFASIFEAAGVPDEANTARRKDKQFCEQCLLYWQSLHYIKGYTLVKKGRAVVAIDVHP